MTEVETADTLPADMAARLADFARACKAAARAVALYPPEHPAIRASLARLCDVSADAARLGPLRIAVLPDNLVIDGRGLARPDAGVTELAVLLHDHLIGQLTIEPGVEADSWRKFLQFISSAPEEIRRQGGIARVWATAAARAIEIVEIDYAQVLREREAGEAASWEGIIGNCLQGEVIDLDDRTLRALLEIAGDASRLAEFTARLQERAVATGNVGAQAAALLRVLRGILSFVARNQPDRMDAIVGNITTAAARLSPDMMLELLGARNQADAGGIDVVGALVTRMSDPNIAQFVARSVINDRGATARLSEAFQALVPELDRRRRLVRMAEPVVAESAIGHETDFERLWKRVEEMLTSYADEAYVSKDYGRELTAARAQALEVERVSDDPPERVASWLTTVTDAALRSLDLRLLLDLLAVESDPFRWRDLTNVVVTHVNDLVLVGDFEAASQLAAPLAEEAASGTKPVRRTAAAAAMEQIITSQLISQTASHLQTLNDEDFQQAKTFCHTLGPAVIKPLAEVLAMEDRARVRQRLTELLLSFGAMGRQSAEQLRHSPNPSVRRTAVYLLREFGGDEALPELESLLDDAEPHVRREAIRGIFRIGTDRAYEVLHKALTSGTSRSRENIMREMGSFRDERAIPLFCYIIGHVDHRGRLQEVYLRAITALGTLGGPEAVQALKTALYRGEWWAPARTATLRGAAAEALAKIGTPDAVVVLAEALERGSRGISRVVRAHLPTSLAG